MGLIAAVSQGASTALVDTLNVLVAPAAALAGALGGAAIANHRSAQRDRARRAENRRDSARGLMVELLHSGRAWSLELAKRSVGTVLQARSPVADGPAGIAEWTAREAKLWHRLEVAVIDVLLRVENLELREEVRAFREAMTRSRQQSQLIEQKVRANDPDLENAVDEMFELANQFDARLDALEASAIKYFAAPVD